MLLRIIILLAILSSLLLVSNSRAEIYKCTVNGKISFTDIPCTKGQRGTRLTEPSRAVKSSNGVPAQWLIGYSGYEQALGISRQLNAPILIYFKADWCRYCKKLERDLFATSDGREALKNVIKVRVKPEDSSVNNEFFRKLGGRGYPTILIQKSHSSQPEKRYLMTNDSGQWRTRGIDYLSSIID